MTRRRFPNANTMVATIVATTNPQTDHVDGRPKRSIHSVDDLLDIALGREAKDLHIGTNGFDPGILLVAVRHT